MSNDESLEKREKVANRWWDNLTPQRKVEIFEREVPDRERRRFAEPEWVIVGPSNRPLDYR